MLRVITTRACSIWASGYSFTSNAKRNSWLRLGVGKLHARPASSSLGVCADAITTTRAIHQREPSLSADELYYTSTIFQAGTAPSDEPGINGSESITSGLLVSTG